MRTGYIFFVRVELITDRTAGVPGINDISKTRFYYLSMNVLINLHSPLFMYVERSIASQIRRCIKHENWINAFLPVALSSVNRRSIRPPCEVHEPN